MKPMAIGPHITKSGITKVLLTAISRIGRMVQHNRLIGRDGRTLASWQDELIKNITRSLSIYEIRKCKP